MIGPLDFVIVVSNSFLSDNGGMNIDLELTKPSVVSLTSNETNHNYRVETHKLMCKKLVPNTSAMLSLPKALPKNDDLIEYLFRRPIVKSIEFPSGQSSVGIDSPFKWVVLSKITMFPVDQQVRKEEYDRNPHYFQQNAISNVIVNVNWNC